jgi:hypothetical protein
VIRLGKKWCEEEKEGDGRGSTPFEAGVAARAIGGSVLGVLHGGGEVGGGGPTQLGRWQLAAGGRWLQHAARARAGSDRGGLGLTCGPHYSPRV